MDEYEAMGHSPEEIATSIIEDLRRRHPRMVMYHETGESADADTIAEMSRGERIMVWASEEQSIDDDGSHTIASIVCTEDMDQWIEEHIDGPEVWSRWVGSQTPAEFLERTPDLSVEDAVDQYVDQLCTDKDMWGGRDWMVNYSEVRDALCKALEFEIYREAGL